MKSKKLKIVINKPVDEVFTFTLDPENTPLWVDSITKEEVNEKPTKLGTIYRNVNTEGVWSEYRVTLIQENKFFVFTLSDNNYNVKYTFMPHGDKATELEYYEWVEKGDLKDPFTIESLEKLKAVMEK